MEFTVNTLLVDVSLISGLLFLAQMLRSKIKFLQNYYIPSSVIAGLSGLFLGPQFLNLLPFSSAASGYAGVLISVLCAGIFLGKTKIESVGTIVNKVGNTFFLNMGAELMGFGFPLLVGGFLITILFPDVFVEICLLLSAGFVGGHGYAASIGGALNNLLGREDAIYIGQTFATIGLLVGLFLGILYINYATRKGATKLVSSAKDLPDECKTGLVPEGKRVSMGTETVHPMSIDPLVWHLALIFTATGIGYGAYNWYKQYFPQIEVPMMCLTMIAGVLIQLILNKIGYGTYVDKKTVDRIGSTVTDYLAAFGVATIRISVVIEFLWPILLLCTILILWTSFYLFFVGRRGFKNFWFERAIFVFGYMTGVIAIGVTLLRIVDPEMKSGTLDDFGSAYTVQAIVELFLISLIPQMTVQFGYVVVGIVVAGFGLACFIANRVLYGAQKGPMNAIREGEAEVIGIK